MYFPEERTVFVVDFITVKRLPYRNLSNSYFPDWIESIKKVEELDFDILAPGHGELGTKEDAVDHRKYLEDLYENVSSMVKQGKSLEAVKKEVTMEKYKTWGQYDAWLGLNIEGVYGYLTNK
jgi:glyoxylase-like metal-dependent hydrolase (beta-lactamase superfamily II)